MQVRNNAAAAVSAAGVKESSTNSKEKAQPNVDFRNIYDSYVQEEVSTVPENYTDKTGSNPQGLILFGPPARNEQEALQNLEKLKSKKAAGEEITEEDVVRCLESDQMTMISDPFSMVGKAVFFSDINQCRKLMRESQENYENNLRTGQPANILEFDRKASYMYRQIYEVLRK